MDDLTQQASPRKKLKTQHSSLDGAMEDINEQSIEPSAATASTQSKFGAPRSDKEFKCAITEFVDLEKPGFSGILKKRYTDFLVNEILPSGEVVHLDNLKAPKKQNAKPAVQSPKKDAAIPEDAPTVEPASAQCSGQHTAEKSPRKMVEPDVIQRQKHKVFVRQTDHGIEEINKEDENQAPQPNGNEGHATSALRQHKVLIEHAQAQSEQLGKSASSLLKPSAPLAPSTAGDWQAYAGNQAEKQSSYELTTADKDSLISYFGSEVVEEILALYNRIVNSPHRSSKSYGSVKSAPITNRVMRTSIHQDLRRIFQARLESATDDDGTMLITAAAEKPTFHARTPNVNHQRKQQGRQPGWYELGGDYLHFSLYKENKDTMEAISYLARQLRVQPKSFQFAGTKDRRGITVQRVSAYRVFADRMVDAGRTLRQAKVGNYEYQPHELRLGDLVGNEFVITLRECRFASDISVKEATGAIGATVSSFRTKGFLNYYGLQRFGTFATSTDTIGIKMLQGDLRGAVDAILDFNPRLLGSQNESTTRDRVAAEDRARAHALDTFRNTGRPHPAIEDLPRKFSAEAAIIRHLGGRNQGNDFQGALNGIPRNLRLMYVHAYQSLVWNAMASERWKKYGDKVIEGDLVLIQEHTYKTTSITPKEEVDTDGDPIIYPASHDRATNADDAFVRARALTKEEVESDRYTIFDIVLPTPGFDVLYPANELADSYKAFMASERGGGLDPHDMRRSWKDISLSGSYRKLMARPMDDVSFEVKGYTEDDEQFVETDLDKLNKGTEGKGAASRTPAAATEEKEKSNAGKQETANEDPKAESAAQAEPDVPEDGGVAIAKEQDLPAETEAIRPKEAKKDEKIAVILKLQLGSSQYATMALRELLGPGGLQTYKPDFGGGR